MKKLKENHPDKVNEMSNEIKEIAKNKYKELMTFTLILEVI